MAGTITRGKATRADLAHWDGRNATVSRLTASGGTVSGLAVGNEVDVLQVFGSGTSRSKATLSTALNYISTNNATIVFAPGTWTIDANVTVPSNVSCRIPAGCIFSVSAGVTLTFSGLIFVEDPSTWTSGSGTVTASKAIPFVLTAAEITAGVTVTNHTYAPGNVLRYGADSTGAATADTAFLAAAQSVDIAEVPDGSYTLSNLALTAAARFRLSENVVLTHAASASDHMIESAFDLTIEGGTIDGNKANRSFSDSQLPVHLTAGKLTLKGVHFQNTLHAAFRANGTPSVVRIQDCTFDGMLEHTGSGGDATMAGVVRVDDAAECEVFLIGNRVSHGTPTAAGRSPGGFLWDGGAAATGTGIKRVVAMGNHFTRIGQNAGTSFVGCLHGYTTGGEFVGGGNEFKSCYWIAIELQNARRASLGNYVVTDHQNVNAIQVDLARNYTATDMDDIDIGRGVITYASGATAGIGLAITGDTDGDDYIQRVVGGPVIISGPGLNGIRIEHAQDVELLGIVVQDAGGIGIDVRSTSDGTAAPTQSQVAFIGGKVMNCGGIGISAAGANITNLHLRVAGMDFEGNTSEHIRGDNAERLTVVGCDFVDALTTTIRAQSVDHVTIVGNNGPLTTVVSTTSATNITYQGNGWQPQGATISDPTGGGTQDAEARTAINSLIDRLQDAGIIA